MSTLIPLLIGMMSAQAMPRPDNVFPVLPKKSDQYIKDGLFTGGDRSSEGIVVRDIRRGAPKAGTDRWVIDLEPNQQSEAAVLKKAPYFQVAVSQDEQRVIVTLWGKPKLEFNAAKVAKELKARMGTSELLPKLDEESWTFSFGLKPGRSVEVFELAEPVRIIIDVRGGTKMAVKSKISKKH